MTKRSPRLNFHTSERHRCLVWVIELYPLVIGIIQRRARVDHKLIYDHGGVGQE